MRSTWQVNLEELDADPHPVLARVRERSLRLEPAAAVVDRCRASG